MIVLLFDMAILFMLILVYLQLLRMRKRNKVVVPSLTLAVVSGSYLHGDTVTIGGALTENEVDVADQTVILRLPDGTTQNLTTDADGKYSTTWIVPDTVSGVLTITASALGISATTTFTLFNPIRGSCKRGIDKLPRLPMRWILRR